MKKNKSKIKLTKKQLVQLKSYWALVRDAQNVYQRVIDIIEKEMQKDIGIKDLEVFHCDGESAGIGNYSRTMSLIHAHELEK